MGSGPTKTKNNINDDWVTIDHLSNYNIMRHKNTGRYGEIRKFRLDPEHDPSKQLKIYQQRKNPK